MSVHFTYAIRVPSGDHAGSSVPSGARANAWVTLFQVASEALGSPLCEAICSRGISELLGPPLLENAYATRSPSGRHCGSRAREKPVGLINRCGLLPSGLTMASSVAARIVPTVVWPSG